MVHPAKRVAFFVLFDCCFACFYCALVCVIANLFVVQDVDVGVYFDVIVVGCFLEEVL